MIVDQDLLRLVKTNEMFKAIPESFLKTFIKPKNFLFVREGTLIYSFDDESSYFYFIVKGEVKIKFCDQSNIGRRSLLDFFGEREILNGSKRSSFVIADKDCTLYKIDAETFKDLIANNQTIADNLNRAEKVESEDLKTVSL
jgi:CRP-like cAMP-binding protein